MHLNKFLLISVVLVVLAFRVNSIKVTSCDNFEIDKFKYSLKELQSYDIMVGSNKYANYTFTVCKNSIGSCGQCNSHASCAIANNAAACIGVYDKNKFEITRVKIHGKDALRLKYSRGEEVFCNSDLNEEAPVEEPVDVQPIVEPVDEPVDIEPVDIIEPLDIEPVEEPIEQPVDVQPVEPVEEPIAQPVDVQPIEPVEEPIEQPVDVQPIEPVEEPIEQPVDVQPVDEPVDEPVDIEPVDIIEPFDIEPFDIEPFDLEPVVEPSKAPASPPITPNPADRGYHNLVINIICEDASSGKPNYFEVNTPTCPDTYHTITFAHSSACPIQKKGLSAGSILLIIIFVTFAVYLIAGVLINICIRNRSGVEAIPNSSFWKELPSLIKDGFTFLWKKITCQKSYSQISINYPNEETPFRSSKSY